MFRSVGAHSGQKTFTAATGHSLPFTEQGTFHRGTVPNLQTPRSVLVPIANHQLQQFAKKRSRYGQNFADCSTHEIISALGRHKITVWYCC